MTHTCPKKRWKYKPKANHRILTSFIVVHPTSNSENYSSRGKIKLEFNSREVKSLFCLSLIQLNPCRIEYDQGRIEYHLTLNYFNLGRKIVIVTNKYEQKAKLEQLFFFMM